MVIREELDLRVGASTLHAWMVDGLPVANGSGKKPRFVWELVRAWLLAQRTPEAHFIPVRKRAKRRIFPHAS